MSGKEIPLALPPCLKAGYDQRRGGECIQIRKAGITANSLSVGRTRIFTVNNTLLKYKKRENKSRIYRIFDPGSTGFNGMSSEAESPAARIMPLLSTPNIFTGARLVTTTTSLPTSSSGL